VESFAAQWKIAHPSRSPTLTASVDYGGFLPSDKETRDAAAVGFVNAWGRQGFGSNTGAQTVWSGDRALTWTFDLSAKTITILDQSFSLTDVNAVAQECEVNSYAYPRNPRSCSNVATRALAVVAACMPELSIDVSRLAPASMRARVTAQ
jgi:hypothetical protein